VGRVVRVHVHSHHAKHIDLQQHHATITAIHTYLTHASLTLRQLTFPISPPNTVHRPTTTAYRNPAGPPEPYRYTITRETQSSPHQTNIAQRHVFLGSYPQSRRIDTSVLADVRVRLISAGLAFFDPDAESLGRGLAGVQVCLEGRCEVLERRDFVQGGTVGWKRWCRDEGGMLGCGRLIETSSEGCISMCVSDSVYWVYSWA
jgi:hypothetical protein